MHKWLLAGIISLAFFLRVPFLDSFPPGFTPDEASFGYDAHSILKTGKDQWGHTLPLFLESFGDFKPPLYAYLTIPSVAILGLNKFATRLPSALLGTAAIYMTYLLVKEFSKNIKFKNSLEIRNLKLEILATLLLAISPWHIMLSRGAFEANLTTFFLPSGILFFLKGLKDSRFLLLSSIVFGLNLFSYHSAKLVTPLIYLFLVFIFRKQLSKQKKEHLVFSTAIFLTFVFLVFYTFTQGAGRRVQDVSIFRGALEAQADVRLKAINEGMSPSLARLLHNKYLVVADRFFDTYKQFWSVKFLFKDGAGETTYGMVPGIGVLYWFELPFLLCFLILYLKNIREKVFLVLLFWILVAPIPAGLTTGVGYAGNRAASMMPALHIASSFGFAWFFGFFKKYLDLKTLKIFGVGITLVVLAFLLSFIKKYLNGSNQLAKGMLYGNLEASYWLSHNTEDREVIIVSRRLSEPHIFIAFANSWNPKDYQAHTLNWQRYKKEGLTFLDQLHEYRLDKYVFQNIDSQVLQRDKKTLLVGRPGEFPDGLNIVQRFKYPDGQDSILVAEPYGDIYAQKFH